MEQNLQLQMVVERVGGGSIPKILVILGIIGIVFLLVFLYRRLRLKRYFHIQEPKQETTLKVQHNFSLGIAPEMERHLKEDERLIIEVLKAKNSRSTQAQLRVATDFSKARLSRLLMELEDRKIVLKEKEGKRNLVFLKG